MRLTFQCILPKFPDSNRWCEEATTETGFISYRLSVVNVSQTGLASRDDDQENLGKTHKNIKSFASLAADGSCEPQLCVAYHSQSLKDHLSHSEDFTSLTKGNLFNENHTYLSGFSISKPERKCLRELLSNMFSIPS